jgi:hypothetical protein
MTENPEPPRRLKPYTYAGPRTWIVIRERYLAGASAPSLAERFGVSVHSIRKRIYKEGWTKRSLAEARDADVANAGRQEPGEQDVEADAVPPLEAAAGALAQAATLMRQGKMTLAAEAARTAEVMTRAAVRLGSQGRSEGEDEQRLVQEARAALMRLAAEER